MNTGREGHFKITSVVPGPQACLVPLVGVQNLLGSSPPRKGEAWETDTPDA